MIGRVIPTDHDWYRFLAARDEAPEEVNFWQPSSTKIARAEPGTPYFFKLKKPHYAVCGFAFFARFSVLPVWLAWQTFGTGNGCGDLQEMHRRIWKYWKGKGPIDTHAVGCILLSKPVFFPPDHWIRQPEDWPKHNLVSMRYDLIRGEGRRIWTECRERAALLLPAAEMAQIQETAAPGPRFGTPRFVAPRLGQGSFRIGVLDAYGRACAVTGEHSLPALEASHIQDYAEGGPHEIRNGLLLRADLHGLFDRGYLTVTPDLRLEVSSRLKEEFHNGHTYYPFHGKRLHEPDSPEERPAREFLVWHNEKRFVA